MLQTYKARWMSKAVVCFLYVNSSKDRINCKQCALRERDHKSFGNLIVYWQMEGANGVGLGLCTPVPSFELQVL